MKLFVYGTLRKGQSAHALLQGAPLIAEAWTDPCFELVNMGDYPGLVLGGNTAVRGEIYDVSPNTLAQLDRYEEAPEVYQRATLVVAGHEVLTYLLPAAFALERPRLPEGDWSPPERL
jgi:gamma-glutamylcyclotransferase (GGCT)/AIG2-like uncharacterized protein YtfP